MKTNFKFLALAIVVMGMSFQSVGQTLSDSLVLYLPFNGNANDESGKTNHGTVNGATMTSDRYGNADRAYYFDGTNDYIEIANSVLPSNKTSYSINFWTKTVGTPPLTSGPDAYEVINDRFGTNCSYKYRIYIKKPASIKYVGAIFNSSVSVSETQFDIDSTSSWKMVTLLYDSNNNILQFFENGILKIV